MSLTVVGGTYREIDLDNTALNIYGSGLRCVKLLLENYEENVNYYTVGDKQTLKHLEMFKNVYSHFNYKMSPSDVMLTFKYYFALDEPRIIPDPKALKSLRDFKVAGADVICFGMLDAEYKVNAERVVYDPQTSFNPIQFSSFGKAKKLIYIVNNSEASIISGSSNIEKILNFFFDKERVSGLIIKNGPFGAKVYFSKTEVQVIPSFKTAKVHKIGSGDIFTATFSYYWLIRNLPIDECAMNASKVTATFCESENYNFKVLEKFNYTNLPITSIDLNLKQVYIAAPIFSLAEVIMIDKIRESLLGFGIQVFSPYHDIGYGEDIDIAKQDLRGLENSDIVFTILDGLDSGTLIELGYALSLEKRIIAYNRTVSDGSILMLKTANISHFEDITTALYYVIWELL